MKTLQRGWEHNLSELFQYADKELVISSPYISDVAAEFLVKNINSLLQQNGVLKFITDLSPKNIYQGTTDPSSFKLLFDLLNSIQIFHLPRLHAKVYVCDEKKQ
ncbi:MAG: hypothetical protein OHK0057_01450 [Thermoflexibacter sp.]